MPSGAVACIARANEKYSSEVVTGSIDTGSVKSRWPDGVVTYCLYNETGDIPRKHWQHIMLSSALEMWRVFIKNIKFVLVKSTDQADIRVRFMAKGSDPYFASPSTLAYTYYPDKNNLLGGDMFVNDDPKMIWSADGNPIPAHIADPEHYPNANNPSYPMIASFNINQTFRHEVGHALGLTHNDTCQKCIMYPFYHNDLAPDQNDIDRVQTAYEKRTDIPTYVISSLMTRWKQGNPF